MSHSRSKSSSDTDDTSTSVGSTVIDKIMCNSLDTILDIYYDFESRFSHNPAFLGNLKSTDITDLLIAVIYEDEHKIKSMTEVYSNYRDIYEAFVIENENDIITSYQRILPLFKTYKAPLSTSVWWGFTFKVSDLAEFL